MRSKSCLCKNLVTTSAPNVKDTPLSFSPQPIVSLNVINEIIRQQKKKNVNTKCQVIVITLSGSDHSKSHKSP